ncbi:heme biosynthesis HemY N-terminal domain-containing protein [Flocculibacter collagenilyticus]|uniref:heme biosynthesis HemY N-terminal domain-containing protein n=1 Tax=Flocculibacter collagenilyticus TaxID=2744479 RepID=UPI0018F5ECB9|nr:heme biosynthesis HemY N-terminal domain-containing protein [Flocculibacter collagenilyticus]
MIRLLIILVLVFGTAVLAPRFISETDFVQFVVGNHTVELSIISFISLSIILIFAFFALEWLIRKLYRIFTGTSSWFGGRASKKAEQALEQGLIAYLLQDWKQANNAFNKTEALTHSQLVRNLYAANVALKLGELAQAQDYLATSEEQTNHSKQSDPVKLYQAQMQFELHQYQRALDTITDYLEKNKKDPAALRLKLHCLMALKEYASIQPALKKAEKYNAFTSEELINFKQQYYLAMFSKSANEQGLAAAKQQWQDIPKADKKETALLGAWLMVLAKQHEDQEVEALMLEQLKHNNIEGLIQIATDLPKVSTPTLCKELQKRLQKSPDNRHLMILLGLVACLNEDFELARKALQPHQAQLSLAAQHRLAEALAQTNDLNGAVAIYQQTQAVKSLPSQVPAN